MVKRYLNTRGGKVQISQAIEPLAEWDHPEKGDALHAFEVALSLEKLNFDKLHEASGSAAFMVCFPLFPTSNTVPFLHNVK